MGASGELRVSFTLTQRGENLELTPEEVHMIESNLCDISMVFVQGERVELNMQISLELVRPVLWFLFVERVCLVHAAGCGWLPELDTPQNANKYGVHVSQAWRWCFAGRVEDLYCVL